MKGWIRHIAAILAVMIICVTLGFEMPLRANASVNDGLVRVYLSQISPKSSHTVTVKGNYQIDSHTDYELVAGKSYKFTLQSGKIVVSGPAGERTLGTSARLIRCKSDSADNYLVTSNYQYPGDMTLKAASSGIDLICTMYLEEYLVGVVCREMSDSWPLEALKAQAVAARTFTIKRLESPRSTTYDMVDTNSDQVFLGSDPKTYANVAKAVKDTANQALYFDGKISDGYYSASNGGQTNTTNIHWNGTNTYHTVKEDPYDAANSASPSAVFAFTKGSVFLDGNDVSAKFATAIGVPNGAAVTAYEFVGLSGLPARAPENSRAFQNLTLRVSYKPSGSSAVTTKDLTITIDKIKSTFGNSGDMITRHRIWTYQVEETGGFRVVGSGYGHGVGMSQRGAQYMAKNDLTHMDILDFYYHGCEVKTLEYTAPVLPDKVGEEEDIPTPDQSQPGEKAVVRLEDASGQLNVRFRPSSASDVVATLKHNDEVDVLAENGDWYYVRHHGDQYGYAHSDYIVFKKDLDEQEKPSAGTVTAPGVPTGLKAVSETANSLRVTWSKVADASGYKLYVSNAADGEYTLLKSLEGSAIIHTGLTAGKEYFYKVSAYKQSGDLSAESEKSTAVSAKPVPGASSLSAVSTTVGKATLSWTKVSGASGYVLSVKQADGSYKAIYDGAELAFEASAEEGAVVTYQVKAYTTVGENRVYGEATEKSVTIAKKTVQVKKQVKLQNTSSYLNWRSGPGTNYSVVGSLKHNDVVDFLSVSGSWSQVTKDGKTGYVLSSYLKDVTGDTGSSTPAPSNPTTTQQGKVKLTSGSLNVRSGAGTSYAKVGSLSNGTVVEILGTSGSWYQIKAGSLTGYVSKSYIVLVTDPAPEKPSDPATPSQPEEPADPPKGTSATVKLSNSSSYLNVRKGAGTSYGVITSVRHGTSVTILETANGWSKIQFGETVGYVSDKYLDRSSSNTNSGTNGTTQENKTGTVKVSTTLNVRRSASSSSAVIGSLKNGTKVTILSTSGSWYQIKTDSLTGYAHKNYIQVG